ncbi:hypothetical protein GP486_001963 [Trichoglossum hirsutum]|uniref:Uncharacterized protein n=1 Tax=Trichoglossum hirsutum TaxID=265104 RepID=A0A9P8LFZ5_9PEZI|nr:hypothetical protein GP486_001963 [Trichoglossum hirsutum]
MHASPTSSSWGSGFKTPSSSSSESGFKTPSSSSSESGLETPSSSSSESKLKKRRYYLLPRWLSWPVVIQKQQAYQQAILQTPQATVTDVYKRNPPSLSLPKMNECNVWMIGNGDFHYTRDKKSFIKYHEINATAAGMEVIGFGTIKLDVWCNPEKKEQGKLILENVLHIPSAACNGFSMSLVPDRVGKVSAADMQAYHHPHRWPMWYGTKFYGLYRLALVNDSTGECPFIEAKKKGDVVLTVSGWLENGEKANLPFIMEQERFSLMET